MSRRKSLERLKAVKNTHNDLDKLISILSLHIPGEDRSLEAAEDLYNAGMLSSSLGILGAHEVSWGANSKRTMEINK